MLAQVKQDLQENYYDRTFGGRDGSIASSPKRSSA